MQTYDGSAVARDVLFSVGIFFNERSAIQHSYRSNRFAQPG